MNKLFDALEVCLNELDNGAELETTLARYPDLAGELRPILITAMKARAMSAAEPAPESIRRGRARLMQRAAEFREAKRAPRKREIPALQRFALTFALLLIFLLSGTGLLSASASALPGESLYPVKRGWESVRLFFIFDREARELLANEFENERLHEIDELLAEGRHELIQFAGVFMQVNGVSYISGLQVILPAAIPAPENGAAVIITGRTNAQGYIEISTLDILPAGSVVPAGKPIEMELEEETASEGETSVTPQAYYEIQGTLEAISASTIVINGVTVHISNLPMDNLCIGMTVEVKGYYAENGRFIATEIETKGTCPANEDGSSINSNDNTNSGSSSSGNDNGDDNEDDGNDDGGNDNEDDDGDDDDDDDDGDDKDSGDDNDND